MALPTTNKRWKYAQSKELDFWKGDKHNSHFSEEYWNWELAHYGCDLKSFVDKTVLEVGCGPQGVIYYLQGDRNRHIGIEPLILSYKNLGYSVQQTSGVNGLGEQLPMASSSVDVVISNNVLDHTHDPITNLHELHRVLADDGQFLFMINIVSPIWEPVTPFLSMIDPPHPHHFTETQVENLLDESNFRVIRKTSRKGAKDQPNLMELATPTHWKYFFAYYAMQVLYIVARKKAF